MELSLTQTVEEILNDHPDAITFFMRQGVRCLQCGEPVWGTLDQLLDEKGFSGDMKDLFLHDLHQFLDAVVRKH